LYKWEYLHPKNVLGAVVDVNDITKIVAWQVAKNMKKARTSYGTPLGARNETESEFIPAKDIIRFTLNDDMSETAPFGESVLRTVYRAHKQKEMLEDAILIYRIQRAPERRVFYIDVGKMPPQRIKTHLEQIKNEIKQKKIPNKYGGKDQVDSVYNPQSMSEDFFFAQRADGKGSRVETLPGGQGLGELADLEYFQDKVWRGLRVPISYMKSGAEGALFNDGKVGVAYIQELRFALYIGRLQGHIEAVLDREFKQYLSKNNIIIDETLYRVRLPEPSNFGTYRQQELDNALLSSYGTADGIPYLSKRFILGRYLQLTDDEIIMNERMALEERGIDPDTNQSGTLVKVYNPESLGDEGMGGLGDMGGPSAFGGMGPDIGGPPAGPGPGGEGGEPGGEGDLAL
jgi:hypothetical protein